METAFQLRLIIENRVLGVQKDIDTHSMYKSCFHPEENGAILPGFQIPLPRQIVMGSNSANVEASRVLCHPFLLFYILPTPW
jgi:hypothetical protein